MLITIQTLMAYERWFLRCSGDAATQNHIQVVLYGVSIKFDPFKTFTINIEPKHRK